MRGSRLLPCACIVAAVLAAPAAGAAGHAPAAQEPLWEFGLGVGAFGLADYRGADTGKVYPLPVPYFIYRGRFLRADRDGVRGRLFKHEFVELNVSLNATTPVRSRRTGARSGMPNLQSTVEIGPSLDLHLWRATDGRARLDLRLPLRAAMSVDSSPDAIGLFFAPRVNIDFLDVAGHSGWNLGILVGPLFADRRYHGYFYDVAPQYATPGRPAYSARGGYSGSQALVSLSKRFPIYWVGCFARYDALSGAAFADSPLVRSNSYWTAGFAIAWMISRSSTMVSSGDVSP